MGNDVRLLITIQQSAIEAAVDLVAELVAPEFDASRWVKLRNENSKSLRAEVVSNTAKILNPELLAESENSMNQDQIQKLA
jgi:hypothetical protein